MTIVPHGTSVKHNWKLLRLVKQIYSYHSSVMILQKSSMVLKCVVAVYMSCLLLLQCNEAAKLQQQESLPLDSDCSAQEEEDLLDALFDDCRDTFNQALNFYQPLATIVLLWQINVYKQKP